MHFDNNNNCNSVQAFLVAMVKPSEKVAITRVVYD